MVAVRVVVCSVYVVCTEWSVRRSTASVVRGVIEQVGPTAAACGIENARGCNTVQCFECQHPISLMNEVRE
jgi:hypothetical protein